MKRTLAPSGRLRARSQRAPSTVIATTALARPGPIEAASSLPVTVPVKVRWLPSGRVMRTISDGALATASDMVLAVSQRL